MDTSPLTYPSATCRFSRLPSAAYRPSQNPPDRPDSWRQRHPAQCPADHADQPPRWLDEDTSAGISVQCGNDQGQRSSDNHWPVYDTHYAGPSPTDSVPVVLHARSRGRDAHVHFGVGQLSPEA